MTRRIGLIPGLILAVALLGGCATGTRLDGIGRQAVANQGAAYTYQYTQPDGAACTIVINSERDVTGAASVTVGDGCALQASVEGLENRTSEALLGLLGQVVSAGQGAYLGRLQADALTRSPITDDPVPPGVYQLDRLLPGLSPAQRERILQWWLGQVRGAAAPDSPPAAAEPPPAP